VTEKLDIGDMAIVMYVCMYVRMYVCIYVCMCVYVCMYVRMYVCIYVGMWVCMYVCMHVCISVCTYVWSVGFFIFRTAVQTVKQLIMFHILLDSDGIFAQNSKTTVQRSLHRVLTLNPKYIIHAKKRNVIDILVFCVINWLFCNIITMTLIVFGNYKYFSTF
jgi:hypothetical protein